MKYYLYNVDTDKRIEVTRDALSLTVGDYVSKGDDMYIVIEDGKLIDYDKGYADIYVEHAG